MRVIYDPFIMLDVYWTEEQVEGSDLHLGFGIWDAQINLGGIYSLDTDAYDNFFPWPKSINLWFQS